MFVVAVGDAFNGITLYGPFATREDAADYAFDAHNDQEAVVVILSPPAGKPVWP